MLGSNAAPCRYWKPHEHGGCRDGDACPFAHPEPVAFPCKYFTKGNCSQGNRCKYEHSGTASSSPSTSASSTPSTSGSMPVVITKRAPATNRLPTDEFHAQCRLGAQSCRGITGKPNLAPLGGNQHALRVFNRMLARERELAGDWGVLYHSYNSPALIYEVQAAIAKILFHFSAKHGALPRLLKQPFEDIPDAPAMLRAFPTWPDKDHNPAFKQVGLCCTTSLVSPDPEATPTQVFLTGYAASTVSIAVLEKLLSDCGAGLGKRGCDMSRKLAQAILDLASKHELSTTSGHMLQIFIRRTLVDKWAYASHPFGVPDKSRTPLSNHLAGSGCICGQARVVVNPSAFMRASSVRLYSYSADATFHRNRSAFQEELYSLLSPILGDPSVRVRAAKGVYGGSLPSWWRDLGDDGQFADVADVDL